MCVILFSEKQNIRKQAWKLMTLLERWLEILENDFLQNKKKQTKKIRSFQKTLVQREHDLSPLLFLYGNKGPDRFGMVDGE